MRCTIITADARELLAVPDYECGRRNRSSHRIDVVLDVEPLVASRTLPTADVNLRRSLWDGVGHSAPPLTVGCALPSAPGHIALSLSVCLYSLFARSPALLCLTGLCCCHARFGSPSARFVISACGQAAYAGSLLLLPFMIIVFFYCLVKKTLVAARTMSAAFGTDARTNGAARRSC